LSWRAAGPRRSSRAFRPASRRWAAMRRSDLEGDLSCATPAIAPNVFAHRALHVSPGIVGGCEVYERAGKFPEFRKKWSGMAYFAATLGVVAVIRSMRADVCPGMGRRRPQGRQSDGSEFSSGLSEWFEGSHTCFWRRMKRRNTDVSHTLAPHSPTRRFRHRSPRHR
jgi:hypothetical protein